jgi:hypothetical protein
MLLRQNMLAYIDDVSLIVSGPARVEWNLLRLGHAARARGHEWDGECSRRVSNCFPSSEREMSSLWGISNSFAVHFERGEVRWDLAI